MRILVVDDDEVDRIHVRRALETSELGVVDIVEADSGQRALERIRSGGFDVVFLDQCLPDIDGIEILLALGDDPSLPPVIAVTGQGDEELVARLMRAGAAHYLPKRQLSTEKLEQIIPGVVETAWARRDAERLRDRLEFIVDSTGTGTWDCDLGPGTCVLSARAARLLGARESDVRTVKALQDLLAVGARWEDAIDPGGDGRLDIEVKTVTAEGVERWTRANGRTVFHGEGVDRRPVRMAGTLVDITRLKQVQSALEHQTASLESLNGIAETLAAELDREGIIQHVTDEATRLTGARFGAFFHSIDGEGGEAYRLYTLSGAPKEAFEPFDMPRKTPLFGPTFRGERIIRYDDVTQAPEYGRLDPHRGMPQGHLPVRSYLAVPVMASDQRVLGALLFGHPEPAVFDTWAERNAVRISRWAALALANARLFEQEKASRRQAEQAVRARDDVLAMVTHDLRNPVGAIAGAAELLDLDLPEKKRRRQLEVIGRAARHMGRLIEDLLDAAKLQSGMFPVASGTVKVSGLLDEIRRLFEERCSAAGVGLTIQEVPPSLSLDGDHERLVQALSNLVSNAVRFTPRGGRITIEVEADGKEVRIRVSDSGPGIAADDLPHLFEQFWQAKKGDHAGAGLGLAIVKGIVVAHDGEVTVQSEPGEGATFTMCLPRERKREG